MEAGDRGSVTLWIDALRCGDEEAARQLWRRYFESLVRLARPRLRSEARGAADEEDVAVKLRQLLRRDGVRPVSGHRRPG